MFETYKRNTRRRKALEAFSRGAYAEAKTHFLAILDDEGERAGHLYNVGLCHLALEEFDSAERYLTRELELFGDHYPRLKTLGDLYFLWGKAEEARRWYERAVAEDPSGEGERIVRRRIELCSEECAFAAAMDSISSYREGVHKMFAKEIADALRLFSTAVEQDSSNIHAWNNIGVICLDRRGEGDVARAIDAFENALSWQEVPSFRTNLERARATRAKRPKRRSR